MRSLAVLSLMLLPSLVGCSGFSIASAEAEAKKFWVEKTINDFNKQQKAAIAEREDAVPTRRELVNFTITAEQTGDTNGAKFYRLAYVAEYRFKGKNARKDVAKDAGWIKFERTEHGWQGKFD